MVTDSEGDLRDGKDKLIYSLDFKWVSLVWNGNT